ncbi:helix-turn-helix domain-containing protein [Anabaena sp. UHCC 0204]|uniref:helix-turn-helix domain-containing protein n=1 Tax=Anabaena sp. UHCC 0204 TaxID=2590009 RepID=UPI0014453990|nr:helix-turn-helix domain-containing protein [Anabaena sp. UHCC 0204]MTJ10742.1 helix-turn-helix domain-containing protein [Anabaena sp. UHCC 0204]
MANKEDKARIWQLLDKGVSIGEIEKTAKTARRTLYRWYSEWKSNKAPKGDDTPIISEIVTEVKSQVESQLDIDFRDDWVNVASKQSIKHCLVNGQIAEELSTILLNEIQQQDINYRAVSALSASINVHSRLHREYGMFYLLDPNTAIKRVEAEGYTINDSNDEPLTVDRSDLSGMSPQELAQEYKKLLQAS